MSQANCFIVLPTETGDIPAGEMVDVQLLEGLI
jgi:molybdopterin molybdotransferase